MRVQNLTTDDLGVAGQMLPAGEISELDEDTAVAVVKGNPDKFAFVDGPPQEPVEASADAPGTRVVDSRAPVHRHYYAKDTGVCRCGRNKPA